MLKTYPQHKNNKNIVLALVQQDGRALKYADASLKQDREIVLTAVQQNGLALEYADPSLKQDREIVFTVINQNPAAYIFLSEEGGLENDPEVKTAAGIF